MVFRVKEINVDGKPAFKVQMRHYHAFWHVWRDAGQEEVDFIGHHIWVPYVFDNFSDAEVEALLLEFKYNKKYQ